MNDEEKEAPREQYLKELAEGSTNMDYPNWLVWQGTKAQGPETERIREAVKAIMRENSEWYKLKDERFDETADEILKIKGLCILSDNQELPENPISIKNAPEEKENEYYMGKHNGVERGFSVMLKSNFRRVIE